MSKSKLLIGKLNAEVHISSEDENYKEVLWLPSSSLAFNVATGGGFPYGRIIELSGEFSSGKSLAGYDAIAQAQKLGGLGIIVDGEGTYDKTFGEKLGINNDELIIYPPELKVKKEEDLKNKEIAARSVEKVSAFLEDTITKVRSIYPMPAPVVIMTDSITALTTLKQIEADMDNATRDMTKAQVLGIMYTRLVGITKHENVILIFINQMRETIDTSGGGSMYKPKEKSTGGKALEFFASLRVKFAKAGWSDAKKGIRGGAIEDENGIKIGQITRIEVTKNKLYPPYNKGEIRTNFDRFTNTYGFDRFYGLVEFLKNERVITQHGAWYAYGETKLGQGAADTEAMLADNPELLEEMFKKLGITYENPVETIPEDLSKKPAGELFDTVVDSVQKHKRSKK